MTRIKRFLALILILCGGGNSLVEAGAQERPFLAQTFFAQSAKKMPQQEVKGEDVSYLLLDARAGNVIATNWSELEKPIPLGSLIKPFTALAYGETHAFRYPRHVCRGTVDGCWRPGGHGELDVTRAIAHSCNSYFQSLTAVMTSTDLLPEAQKYHFNPPSEQISGAALAGRGNQWQIAPIDIARAYLELVQRRDDPGIKDIVDGLKQSAKAGTGAQVDASLRPTEALSKTGTAACTHSQSAPGDGFVVVLTPADQPQLLLLVRLHGAPGASAARVAGELLHRIVE